MVLGDDTVRDRNLFEANFGSSRKSKSVIFTRDITVFSGKNLVPVKEKPMRHAVYFHKGIHAKKLRTRADLIPSLIVSPLLQLMIRSQGIGERICARYSAKVETDGKLPRQRRWPSRADDACVSGKREIWEENERKTRGKDYDKEGFPSDDLFDRIRRRKSERLLAEIVLPSLFLQIKFLLRAMTPVTNLTQVLPVLWTIEHSCST